MGVTPCQPKCGIGSTPLCRSVNVQASGDGLCSLLPTSVKLMELVQCVGRRSEERFEEVFGILVVIGEDRVGREWSKGYVDDS